MHIYHGHTPVITAWLWATNSHSTCYCLATKEQWQKINMASEKQAKYAIIMHWRALKNKAMQIQTPTEGNHSYKKYNSN